MRLCIDFNKKCGKIKPLHGVGQPPFVGVDYSYMRYLTDASVPYSRLHDVGGPYGGMRYVDIPNIFRNFDADPTLPESYDFAFTDSLITALVEHGVEPYFRLGVTIENYARIRAYNIFPPKDYKKWAVICEHIIRHYTEGWADGFNYKITYWEIWNEPDNFEDPMENQMWRGTKEEYYELYGIAATHLKSRFPHLKIGGYGSCGFYSITGNYVKEAASSPRYDYFITFLDGFVDYVNKNKIPIDFFSWHSYDKAKNNERYAKYAKERFTSLGIECEIHVNEWNTEMSKFGTAHHAAAIACNMMSFQHLPVDEANFYDARIGLGVFGSLFNCITKLPYPAYYVFRAFGELYRLGTEAECEIENDDVYALSAVSGQRGAVMIANPTESSMPFYLEANGKISRVLITDEDGSERTTDSITTLSKNSVTLIEFDL